MKGRIYPNSENFIGSDGATASSTKGSVDYGQIISEAGQVAGTLITALGSVKDAKLRREYEQRIAELDRQEQKALADKLAKSQSSTERNKIFADFLSQTTKSRIESNVPKNMQIGLWVFGGVVILGSAFYILKKFNK